MKKSFLLILFSLCLFGSLFAQNANSDLEGIGLSPEVMDKILKDVKFRDDKGTNRVTRCKGTYLRTDIRGSQSEYSIQAVVTVKGESNQPSFMLKKIEHRTLTEVKIYEALLRIFTPGEDEDHGTYDYERLNGETWEGETTERTITQEAGPLANTDVIINGLFLKTDEDGLIRDPENKLDILQKFDDLSTRQFDFIIDVPSFAPIEVSLTRTMPQRRESDEMRIEEDENHELLLAYALDFRLSKKKPEQDKLVCKAFLPENFKSTKAGSFFPITVTVKNDGDTQTSCLIARSFSRIKGLNGKLFYFGAIQPGETKSFTRIVKIDETEKCATAALEIRFSDSWSTPKQSIPLKFSIEPQAKPAAKAQ